MDPRGVCPNWSFHFLILAYASRVPGVDIHPQSAPAEIEEALRFVGHELRGDLEEAAARVDDDAGSAQDGELL